MAIEKFFWVDFETDDCGVEHDVDHCPDDVFIVKFIVPEEETVEAPRTPNMEIDLTQDQ